MFDEIEKSIKKMNKRNVLANNRYRGKLAEDCYAWNARMSGKKVTRKAHGSDYIEQKVDMFGNPTGKKIFVEVKSSSTAKLSKLQQKRKREKKGNYKIQRMGF